MIDQNLYLFYIKCSFTIRAKLKETMGTKFCYTLFYFFISYETITLFNTDYIFWQLKALPYEILIG